MDEPAEAREEVADATELVTEPRPPPTMPFVELAVEVDEPDALSVSNKNAWVQTCRGVQFPVTLALSSMTDLRINARATSLSFRSGRSDGQALGTTGDGNSVV
jgi:hypothetical protein